MKQSAEDAVRSLCNQVAHMANVIHQAYHPGPGGWQECTRSFCSDAKRAVATASDAQNERNAESTQTLAPVPLYNCTISPGNPGYVECCRHGDCQSDRCCQHQISKGIFGAPRGQPQK